MQSEEVILDGVMPLRIALTFQSSHLGSNQLKAEMLRAGLSQELWYLGLELGDPPMAIT
jgi:hypothetical protein